MTTPTLTIDPSLQPFHPGSKPLDDIADMPDLVKLNLEFVDLAEDIADAGDFMVGGGDG